MKKMIAWALVFPQVKVMLPVVYLNLPPGYGMGAGFGGVFGSGKLDVLSGNGWGCSHGERTGAGFGQGQGYGTNSRKGSGTSPLHAEI
jgi:hypothetical protein